MVQTKMTTPTIQTLLTSEKGCVYLCVSWVCVYDVCVCVRVWGVDCVCVCSVCLREEKASHP